MTWADLRFTHEHSRSDVHTAVYGMAGLSPGGVALAYNYGESHYMTGLVETYVIYFLFLFTLYFHLTFILNVILTNFEYRY